MVVTNQIQKVRKAAKMSQTDLANRLGKTQPTISGWESGEYSPDMKDIVSMCELFSVTPNQLLGFDGTAPLAIAPRVVGAHIACADGDAITISQEEENFLIKCLAKARSGQMKPDIQSRGKKEALGTQVPGA